MDLSVKHGDFEAAGGGSPLRFSVTTWALGTAAAICGVGGLTLSLFAIRMIVLSTEKRDIGISAENVLHLFLCAAK